VERKINQSIEEVHRIIQEDLSASEVMKLNVNGSESLHPVASAIKIDDSDNVIRELPKSYHEMYGKERKDDSKKRQLPDFAEGRVKVGKIAKKEPVEVTQSSSQPAKVIYAFFSFIFYYFSFL
jgi:hypothetical protein